MYDYIDDMNRIVLCKQCGKPEYYGEMRWISGAMICRDCYKSHYEKSTGKLYEWDDLNGKRPTMREYNHQKGIGS